ncbi:hypothetical protein [Streptomyces sp. NRRL S-1448]|uniref:hypothetical protein n=1 Tax=Streptomyces sp. NRRL S-1448 TaxID=1463883 RepID=UPI0018FEC25C|nr:hypothetical protein [Streptomyces sp. NRRL S-1448]
MVGGADRRLDGARQAGLVTQLGALREWGKEWVERLLACGRPPQQTVVGHTPHPVLGA